MPMNKESEWLMRAAAAGERVGVVDRSGLLVNVGRLSQGIDERRVMFSSELSGGFADVWLEEAGESDEFGCKIAPMTPEREKRWRLIWNCHFISPWSRLPDAALEKILEIVKNSMVGDV